jgi:uncharacterized protein YecE (DUF72 family)
MAGLCTDLRAKTGDTCGSIMQNPLFDDLEPLPEGALPAGKRRTGAVDQGGEDSASQTGQAAAARPRPSGARGQVAPVAADPELQSLAAALPRGVWLGSSTWTYPGWDGFVWGGAYSESALSRHGLPAYAAHPLLHSVCLDRSFYRPLTIGQYASLAAQVPADFRFIVKAPSLVTDALIRGEGGRGLQANAAFLDPALAIQEFVQPAMDGLGLKIGALVFQISPLPGDLLGQMPALLERIRQLLAALPSLQAVAPDGTYAVEVRDPAFIRPEFAQVLRETGATFCLGLHAKMPPLEDQLPLLRALWPGPLVCRWNYNRIHGAYGYEDAEKRYAPFDRLVDPDPATRQALARVIRGVASAGQPAYVAISNKAEGSAPLSVIELAREVVRGGRQSAVPTPG